MRYSYRLFVVFILALAFFSLKLYSYEGNNLFAPNSEKQGFQFINKAEKLRLEGEFEKSLKLYEKSLYQAKKTPDKTSECKILLKIGLLYWNLGQMDKSREVYSYALTLAQKSSFIKLQTEADTALRIHSLYVEAKKYRSQGQHQKSAECFQEAIDLARKAGSQDHELKCLRQLSIIHWEVGDLKKFYTLNEKALRIAQTLNHKKEQARCLNNIGLYYWKLDNYSKALSYYEKALKIAQYLKNKEEESAA
ncbi:MAG: tetratricopeptide repeat protein, partial [Acidobacteriota bacterium]|nr:tetratricopeptide repeat protein [Acidobacteriota bacterium]